VFIAGKISKDMGVSQNRGTTKSMVFNGKLYKMDDLGIPLFLETPMVVTNLQPTCGD